MQKNNKKNTEQCTLYGVKLSYLTEDEKKVISLIEKGESIAGKENIKKAIINWINMCLANRIISN